MECTVDCVLPQKRSKKRDLTSWIERWLQNLRIEGAEALSKIK